MRKVVFRIFLFFIASKMGFAWSEETFEEKAKTFMKFFRIAGDFVVNNTSCPNNFSKFHSLFKNLHEDLDKLLNEQPVLSEQAALEGQQEEINQEQDPNGVASPVPPAPPAPAPPMAPPPPLAPAPPPLPSLRVKEVKKTPEEEAESFVAGDGLLESFGGYEVHVLTYEQFVAMTKNWKKEAEEVYKSLFLQRFCCFFDRCRFLLSAFLDHLCTSRPRETQSLAQEVKCMLKNPNTGRAEPEDWQRPLNAFRTLFNEGGLRRQLEGFLEEMFCYGFSLPSGKSNNLRESLETISLQAGAVANATEGLKDWPYGCNAKGKINEALRLHHLSPNEKRWLRLSEVVSSLSVGKVLPRASDEEICEVLGMIPKYKEMAHEKLYRFLEQKYNDDCDFKKGDAWVKTFQKVAKWSNTLENINWDVIETDSDFVNRLENQFISGKARRKIRAARVFIEARGTYEFCLQEMQKFYEIGSEEQQPAETGIEGIRKTLQRLKRLATGDFEYMGGQINTLETQLGGDGRQSIQLTLDALVKTIKAFLEKEKNAERCGDLELEFLEKLACFLSAWVNKILKKEEYEAQSTDIVSFPVYRESFLEKASAELGKVDVPFGSVFSDILGGFSTVQIQEHFPFLGRAVEKSKRPFTVDWLVRGTPVKRAQIATVNPTTPLGKKSKKKEEQAPSGNKDTTPEVQEPTSEVENLKKRLEVQEGMLAEFKKRNEILENENEILKNENRDFREKIKKLNAEYRNVSEECDRLSAENERLKNLIASINNEKELLEETSEKVKEERDSLVAEKTALKTTNNQLVEENNALKNQLKNKVKTRGSSGSTIIRTNDEAEQALRAELTQKDASLGAKERELNQKDEEILSLQNSIAELRQKLSEAEGRAKTDKKRPGDAFGSETNDLEVQRQELEMVRQELVEQQSALQRLQVEQENRTKNLDAREKAIKAKENKLAVASEADNFGSVTGKVPSKDIAGADFRGCAKGSSVPQKTAMNLRPTDVPMALSAKGMGVVNSKAASGLIKPIRGKAERKARSLLRRNVGTAR